MRRTIEVVVVLALFIVSIALMIYGIVMMNNLKALDYATQIQQYGFYKSDVHVLPNYFSENLKYSLIALIPFLSSLGVGLLTFLVELFVLE